MKLHYFKDPQGNFGDDLNPWLWGRLLPDWFDEDDSEIFVGIGTLLNHRLPPTPVKHIFGSGYGYGDPPKVDERFVIHAVRGYGTAQALGIDPALVITDPAVLLRAVSIPRVQHQTIRFGFMPHCQSSRYFDWGSVCADVGFKYISAEWDVNVVLTEMTTCEVMICEAMHGAIAADSLRIPWIPVSCYDHIAEFKWKDWLSTLNLPYQPAKVTSLYDAERFSSVGSRAKSGLKRSLSALGIWSGNWTPPPPARTGRYEYERAATELLAAARCPPYLSNDAVVGRHVDRYLELVRSIRSVKRKLSA